MKTEEAQRQGLASGQMDPELKKYLLMVTDAHTYPDAGECRKCGAVYTKSLYANKCARYDIDKAKGQRLAL